MNVQSIVLTTQMMMIWFVSGVIVITWGLKMNKDYKITTFDLDRIKSLSYMDLETHYDEVLQDCTELLEYLKNLRERLIIYREEH